jgi:hypothetical protein
LALLLVSLARGQVVPSTEVVPSTDPKDFACVVEQPFHGKPKAIKATNTEVDDRSIIKIIFHTDRMKKPEPTVPGSLEARPWVRLRVEVYSSKGVTRSPIAPIPHYIDLISAPPPTQPSDPGKTKETVSSGTVVYHDKYFNPAIGANEIPDTEFNLRGTQAGDADFLEVRITNLVTQQSLIVTLTPQKFGFRTKVSDSFLLLKRLGINSAELASGFDPSNFSPAPGVTYGGVFTGRGGVGRYLQPGIGVNVCFINWSDPAIDKTTGLAIPDSSTSSVQVGTGAMFSFFSNILQFTVGANLNATKHRFYWGIGFSFVNLAERLNASK